MDGSGSFYKSFFCLTAILEQQKREGIRSDITNLSLVTISPLPFLGQFCQGKVHCHASDSLSQEQRDHIRGQEATKVAGFGESRKEGQ